MVNGGLIHKFFSDTLREVRLVRQLDLDLVQNTGKSDIPTHIPPLSLEHTQVSRFTC